MNKKPHITYVTQPSLPDYDEFTASLKEIWDNKILTNNGPIHQLFENELTQYLKVPYLSLFNNGTIALLTALQALEIEGEVITTPYSFVATANSLIWNRLTPVFCDVDPNTGNINPSEIERHITSKTSAILPVHVYGTPCEVETIQEIANKYNLKVIYDAAHAFGVELNGTSILNYGDLSVLSFHATKTFNTIEGGAIICHSPQMKQKIDNLKNFGITNEVTVVSPGINGKMNEVIAAYGRLQLKNITSQIFKRKEITEFYRELLQEVDGISTIYDFHSDENVKNNYSYFPIFIDHNVYKLNRDQLYQKLKDNNIYGRRYFYPLITDYTPFKEFVTESFEKFETAKRISNSVICLPLYSELSKKSVSRIVELIANP